MFKNSGQNNNNLKKHFRVRQKQILIHSCLMSEILQNVSENKTGIE